MNPAEQWTSGPVLAPLDAKLVALIDNTAVQILMGQASFLQLQQTYAEHPMYGFLNPANNYLHAYFNWALQCKRVNPMSDPGEMARIAIKPPLLIPPKHPVIRAETNKLNSDMTELINSFIDELKEFWQKENYVSAPIDNAVNWSNELFNHFTSHQTVQLLSESVFRIKNQILQKNDTNEYIYTTLETVGMFFFLFLQCEMMQLGLAPIPDEPFEKVYPDFEQLNTTIVGSHELLTVLLYLHILSYSFVISTDDNFSYMEVGVSQFVDEQVLWCCGVFPWFSRYLTLYFDYEYRNMQHDESLKSNCHPTDILHHLIDYIWRNRLARKPDWDIFHNWRVCLRIGCDYGNRYRIQGPFVIFENARTLETPGEDPYLSHIDDESGAQYGALGASGVGGGLVAETVPVGVLATMLLEASSRENSLHRPFVPYQTVDNPPTTVPPLLRVTPPSLISKLEQCSNDIHDTISGNGIKRDCERAEEEPISTNIDLLRRQMSQPPPPPAQPEASAPRWAPTMSVYHQDPNDMTSSMAATKIGIGANTDRSGDLYSSFRQRRSQTYYKNMIQFKNCAPGSTPLRCYVCQQMGHFAKDCKFGLN